MNNDTQLIWEAKQRQAILLENSELVWQALQEAQNALEEAKITSDMVSQINQSIGTNLSIDQLQQIQQITNPGIGKAIGGALGKLGGFLKNAGSQAAGFAKQQVTDPNSGLRQGIQKGAELAKQGAGAVARGVEKGAGAVSAGADAVGAAAGDFADGVKDGYGSTQQPDSSESPVRTYFQPNNKRDQRGRFMKGNQRGVQFAEQEEEELEDVVNESILRRPGWANKTIN